MTLAHDSAFPDRDDEVDGDLIDDDLIDDAEEPVLACPECGADVHEDTQRCPFCGMWITPVEKHQGPKRLLFTIVTLLAAASILAWIIL